MAVHTLSNSLVLGWTQFHKAKILNKIALARLGNDDGGFVHKNKVISKSIPTHRVRRKIVRKCYTVE